MSKIRTAAVGAVMIAGLAFSAGAQTPAPQDGGRGVRDGEARRERVERQRRMGRRGDERGIRGGREMRGRGMREARVRGMRHGANARRDRLAELNLTEAQRTRIRAIHEKYQQQYRTLREQTGTQMRSLRPQPGQVRDTSAAARQRLMQERQQIRSRFDVIRRQEQAEIRTVFTAEQRAKVDAARNERARRLEERAKQLQDEARQLRSIR
jgi:Spy/CpxP family protein refolding chaperone